MVTFPTRLPFSRHETKYNFLFSMCETSLIFFWWVYVTNDNDCITLEAVAQQTVLCLLTTASAESLLLLFRRRLLRKNKWAHQAIKNLYALRRSLLFLFPTSCISYLLEERSIIAYDKSLGLEMQGESKWVRVKMLERWTVMIGIGMTKYITQYVALFTFNVFFNISYHV